MKKKDNAMNYITHSDQEQKIKAVAGCSIMSDSGNSSVNSSEYSSNSPGPGSRYSGAYSRGYPSKSYHRGSGGRYGNYKDNSYSSYHYRGDYYYGPSRYYSSRGGSRGGARGGASQYNHSPVGDYQSYNNNSFYGGRRSYDDSRRLNPSSNGRYYSGRYSEPWGTLSEPTVPSSQYSGPYVSGNNTPVDHYRRHPSSVVAPMNAPATNISAGSTTMPSNMTFSQQTNSTLSSFSSPRHSIAPATIKRRVDKDESPFYYLTDLDKSSNDPKELESIRQVFKEGDRLDKQLEEHNFNLLKSELELGLLATQCEKDKLSVQLTQEKLDTFLMQN